MPTVDERFGQINDSALSTTEPLYARRVAVESAMRKEKEEPQRPHVSLRRRCTQRGARKLSEPVHRLLRRRTEAERRGRRLERRLMLVPGLVRDRQVERSFVRG